jgi:DNA polymerase III alpha subunit
MICVPLFKSHYSFGRSILTLENKEENTDNSADSIFPLLKQADLKELFLVEDHFSGFLQANKNCSDLSIKLNYGLRFTICDDYKDKSEESLNSNSKVVVFAKNLKGYKRLVKLYTHASTEGFYYEPRTDWKILQKIWSDNDLLMAFPFYDSFVFNNLLTNKVCQPDLFTEHFYFIEDNDLPFDDIVRQKLESSQSNLISAKSIYYSTKNDFPAYLTFRCINNRTTLSKPNLEHMSSDRFCFESWKEDNI